MVTARSWAAVPLLSVFLCLAALADPPPLRYGVPKTAIEVQKMILCRDLKDLDAREEAKDLKAGESIIGWCQIRSGLGEVTITHRWRYGGEVVSDVKLLVKHSPYRTWSRKTLSGAGRWVWQILNPQGEILKEVSFTVSR